MIPPLTLDDHTLYLVHQVIDGEASAAERAELAALVAASPRIADALEAFRFLNSQLATVPLVDAPAQIKPAVMAAIRSSAASSPVVSINVQRRRPYRRLAVAAAALVAIGLASFLATRTVVRPSEAGAVMGGVEAGEWVPLIGATRGTAGHRFTLEVGKRGDRLRVQSHSESAAAVAITWDDSDFQLEEVSTPDPVSTTGSGVAFASGVSEHAVVLRKKDGASSGRAVIRLETEGREIIRRSVSLP